MHPFSHDSTHLRLNLNLGPLPVDDNAVVAGEDLDPAGTANWAVGSTATVAKAYLSPARNLIVTPTDADSTTMTLTVSIAGKNQFGQSITESVSVTGDTAGQTSACFSVVESVTCTAVSGHAASDTLDIGPGDRVALPFKCSSVSEVVAILQVPTAANDLSSAVSAAGSSTYVDTDYDCLKGLTLVAGDVLNVTVQIESTGSDSRFAG